MGHRNDTTKLITVYHLRFLVNTKCRVKKKVFLTKKLLLPKRIFLSWHFLTSMYSSEVLMRKGLFSFLKLLRTTPRLWISTRNRHAHLTFVLPYKLNSQLTLQITHKLNKNNRSISTMETSHIPRGIQKESVSSSQYGAILQMNGHGISLLQDNRFADAARTFKTAVTCLKNDLSLASNALQQSSQPQVLGISKPSGLHSCLCSYPLPNIAAATDNETFKIFARPLGLISSHTSDPQRTSVLLSGILLFNVALSSHLMGLASRSTSSSVGDGDLSQAMLIYDLALSAFSDDAIVSTDQSLLALLAVANNRGHIFAVLGAALETQRCQEQLVVGLGLESTHLLLRDEHDIFAWNVVFPFDPKQSLPTAPVA